jgi:hypothetical protein
MPTDPKFKTIARVSQQPISLVISMYVHLLISASRNVTRGHADVTQEDLASALDVTEGEIELIFNAMQGRVLDGNYLTGWEKRQVKREENLTGESFAKSSAERKREERARKKAEEKANDVTQCHDVSRNVTLDKDKEEDKEIKPFAQTSFERFWSAYPKKRSKGDAERAFAKLKPNERTLEIIISKIGIAKTSDDWTKDGGQFIPYPASWLKAKGWEDELHSKPNDYGDLL